MTRRCGHFLSGQTANQTSIIGFVEGLFLTDPDEIFSVGLHRSKFAKTRLFACQETTAGYLLYCQNGTSVLLKRDVMNCPMPSPSIFMSALIFAFDDGLFLSPMVARNIMSRTNLYYII